MNTVILIVVALITAALLDFIWIGTVASSVYMKGIGSLARLSPSGSFNPDIPSAIAVYVLIALGLIFFVLPKTISAPIGISTFLWGACMGLVLYGVYDLTNYSFLAGWPLSVVIADIVWGTFLSGILTVVLTFVAQHLK